jgi:hypothetical protein
MEVMRIATERLLFCPWSFLRFCVDMVVVLVLSWCCPLVFLCVVCSKNGVILRNYLFLGGANVPDQSWSCSCLGINTFSLKLFALATLALYAATFAMLVLVLIVPEVWFDTIM